MKTWKDIKEGDTIYYWDKAKLHAQRVYEVINEEKESKVPIGRNEWHVSTYKELTIKAGANDKSYAKNPTTIKFSNEYWTGRSVINYNRLKRFSCLEAANTWLETMYGCYDMKRQRLEKKLASINKHINVITEVLYRK